MEKQTWRGTDGLMDGQTDEWALFNHVKMREVAFEKKKTIPKIRGCKFLTKLAPNLYFKSLHMIEEKSKGKNCMALV